VKTKLIQTTTALALLWPVFPAQAETPDYVCLPSASGGWDCRDGSTAATLPPRPPTVPVASDTGFMGEPAASPLERYMASDGLQAPASSTAATAATGAALATMTPAPGDSSASAPAGTTAAPAPRAPIERLATAPTAVRSPVASNLNSEGYLGGLFAARPDQLTLDAINIWGQCSTGFDTSPVPPKDPDAGEQPIDITADSNEIFGEELAEFKGNVEYVQGLRVIHTDFLRFDIPENQLELIGKTYMKDRDIEVWGNYAQFDMNEDEGLIEKAGYRLNSRHAQGRADTIRFEDHSDIIRLEESTYSTCPAVKEDWVINSENITLDNVEQEGVARNATLRFKGVPVAWTPYMSFPLTADRKTGLLRPRVSVGDKTGADVTVPYYWNIAPNMDATLGLRGMTKRGVQVQGQFRYLFKSMNDGPYAIPNTGTISAEFLPSDSEYNDTVEDPNSYRAAASFQQYGHVLPNVLADINVNWASDDDYFRDLGSNLISSSTQFLERRGDLTYEGSNWKLRGRLQEFQTLDLDVPDALKPYKVLPQFLFETTYPWRLGMAELDVRAEAVNWSHDERVDGQRYDIQPSISVPFVSLWGYVTPKAGVRYTNYNLSDQVNGKPDSINRFIPIGSVDAGMFFERETSFGGTGLTQTFEPRLYYLYVQDKEQDDIPLFDTFRTDFSFAQLFQENRFSGSDRVGDANQVSLALTSRLLESDSGQERLSASIGQIYYFKDREVTLLGVPETNNSSELAFGLSASPGSYWDLDLDVQYSPELSLLTKRAVRINYKRDYDHIVNLSYRRRDISDELNDVNQVGFSSYWGIANQWKVITNVAYDLEQSQLVDLLGGVHYDTCCWSVMLAYRRYVNNDSLNFGSNVVNNVEDPEYNNSVLLMFELKGLGRYGQQLYDLMEKGILGYNAPKETTL